MLGLTVNMLISYTGMTVFLVLSSWLKLLVLEDPERVMAQVLGFLLSRGDLDGI